MDEKKLNAVFSADCALIVAISGLAAGLSKVPGFDQDLAVRTIDQYIKNPVHEDIRDREAYEQVLDTVKFLIKHPIQCEGDDEDSGNPA